MGQARSAWRERTLNATFNYDGPANVFSPYGDFVAHVRRYVITGWTARAAGPVSLHVTNPLSLLNFGLVCRSIAF